jgi:hypothetical protein
MQACQRMKNKLVTLLICCLPALLSLGSKAQDTAQAPHSTIYLVRTNSFVGSAVKLNVNFKNQESFDFPVGGIVECEIYSEGKMVIVAETEYEEKIRCKLDVKKGNVYYVYFTFGQFSEVPKEKVQKLLDMKRSFSKFREDINSPIITR